MHINMGTYGEFSPHIYSTPPYRVNEDGTERGASIEVAFTGEDLGPQVPTARVSLDLEEAEDIARRILAFVDDARAGKFSDYGRQIIDHKGKRTALA